MDNSFMKHVVIANKVLLTYLTHGHFYSISGGLNLIITSQSINGDRPLKSHCSRSRVSFAQLNTLQPV